MINWENGFVGQKYHACQSRPHRISLKNRVPAKSIVALGRARRGAQIH